MSGVDTIVVGLGAVGVATLMQLARRGQRVIGLDRFDPPHDRGSSHGETRITRCAVGEGESYVPLALRSHEIWRELEAETGTELLTQCGALMLAGASNTAPVHGKGDFVRSTIAVAVRFGIPHEVLDADEIVRRFPQFRLQGDEIASFEPGGGFVRPERCIAAQLEVARRHGATIQANAQVMRIERDGAGACVTLADGTRLHAADVVLAAGAWSPGLAGPPLAPRMQVLRQVLNWFEPVRASDYAPGRFPVFIWVHGATADDSFYGFPVPHDGTGVKVAREQYGAAVDDPDHIDRTIAADEASSMFADHVQGRLAGLTPRALRSKVCMYTMTEAGDFLVGRNPENERVLLVSACSGHGFKHSAGLGEVIAESLTGTGQARTVGEHVAAPWPEVMAMAAG